MPHTEKSVNTILAEILRPMFARAKVAGEDTGSVTENSSLQLDLLITAPGRSPVSIETEFMPARTVEVDALSRLGKTAKRDSKTIEAAIAVRYPEKLRNDDVGIRAELRNSRLSYAMFTLEGSGNSLRSVRFPESGWLEGDVGDLATLARLVSVPQRAVNSAAQSLEAGINSAASVLADLDAMRGQINIDIANVLGMENVEQTRRMASAIVANAMVFHERIVGMHTDARIKTLDAIAGSKAANPKGDLLESWRQILAINYHPIFDIARRLIECLPAEPAARLIRILAESGNYVNAAGIDNAHDLTGRVFQRLISDRKYLATFYTRPQSAALLAQLAVARMEGIDWSDASKIGELRIADFACGTGALLSAVYGQIALLHAGTGNNPRDLHKSMLEDVLIGCDVMPSAVHITAATLAGVEPDITYSRSQLFVMPYGAQQDGGVKIGSLEFLATDSAPTLTSEDEAATRVTGEGMDTTGNVVAAIANESLDLVIMNPPFTRAGSDWEGINREEDSIKQFRGLSTTLDSQKEMSVRLKKFARGTSYHGYAGIASAFVALADRKLKQGGVLALVLPISAAAGMSWQGFRRLIGRSYADVEVLSITSNGGGISFSADTSIAECLIIAKKNGAKTEDTIGRFASIERRPRDLMGASILAKAIADIDNPRSISDGPYGGTSIMVGQQVSGELMELPVTEETSVWGTVRLLDGSVAQTAHALSQSKLWLPRSNEPIELPVTNLGEVAMGRGWHHINIAGSSGPFDKRPWRQNADIPALWNHHADRETRLVCEPDLRLEVRKGMERRAAEAWQTASRAHMNLDFRFNSQPLAGAFTASQSIGGRAWPNILFNDSRFDYVFSLWLNCTLGLLSYWWHSSRQQSGRGITTISAIGSLPVLDFRELSDSQLATAERIFDEFRDKEFMPAYLADADPSRDLLDRRVIVDLLGFDEDTYLAVRRLAQKWCAEPSVHGGKARPRGSHPIPG